MVGVFDSLHVVELATGVAGPFCGKLLAGLGADVLKVEPPAGDSTRRDGPFPVDQPHIERSCQFLHLNTAKQSMTLNLRSVEGRSILQTLLTEADILIVDLRPAELAASEIDLAQLRATFPRLIIVSVTGFGLTGPYANYLGSELVACALSGYLLLTGLPER